MFANLLLINSGLWVIATTYLFYTFFAAFLLQNFMIFLLAFIVVAFLTITEIALGALGRG